MDAISDRREARMPTRMTIRQSRPSSVKGRACSERIIQLALPSLHIVSSVLKEHFRTLSKEHVERLENLMEQIKTARVSVSQINFIDAFQDFQESDKKKIIEVIDEVHSNNCVEQFNTEWKQLKLLPVKSSSDTFLISLNKHPFFGAHTKNDKSSDSFFNAGTCNGIRKAVESMKWNYRETVLIKLEGVHNSQTSSIEEKNKMEKFVQTEDFQPEISNPINMDITVLYVQRKNATKKTKVRQLHTLVESNEFLRSTVETECNTMKCDKSNQTINDSVKLNDDIKDTINHLCELCILTNTYMNLLRNVIGSAFDFFSQIILDVERKAVENVEKLKERLLHLCYVYQNPTQSYPVDPVVVTERRKKKKKIYYTKSYHFTNIASILH